MKSKKEDSKANILVVAGEPSGDLLGGAILKAWSKKNANISFIGTGGDSMKPYLDQTFYNINQMATIGLVEIIRKYRRLKSYIKNLVEQAQQQNCRFAVLIDFPGFNLKLAEALKDKGIESILIVSPQIWAWHYSRIYTMKKILKAVYCLYDFEVDLYKEVNLDAKLIGHPLKSMVESFLKTWPQKKNSFFKEIGQEISKKMGLSSPPINTFCRIALLPGSRHSEVARNLPVFLKLVELLRQDPAFQNQKFLFLIPAANAEIEKHIRHFSLPDDFIVMQKKTHEILASSQAGIVCSGTATLECALVGMPFLLMYQTSAITYHIMKRLVNISFIGIVNIIAQKAVTKEFIQKDVKIENMLLELKELLFHHSYRKKMKQEFARVKKSLGKGDAAQNAASYLQAALKSGSQR